MILIILKEELLITTFNLEVGGDFSNNDASIGFVWKMPVIHLVLR